MSPSLSIRQLLIVILLKVPLYSHTISAVMSWIKPATSLSDDATRYPKERPSSYHQFLTRPVQWQLVDFQQISATHKRRPTLREVADRTSSVLDLSFQELCSKVSLSLDHRHDVTFCSCCKGKHRAPVVGDESMRHFVLVLCGGFRELSVNKQSWPWELMVQLFSSFETSCAHKVNSPGPEDTFPMDCESILCPNVRKTAYISSVHSSHEFTFTSFHDIPALLSALNSSFFTQPFHLSISSLAMRKHLTIIAVPPVFITQPKTYHSYISTQCFVQKSRLPNPDFVQEKDFGIVGIFGTDYATFEPIRKALRTIKVATEDSQFESGYDNFLRRARSVAKNWTSHNRRSKGSRSPSKRKTQTRKTTSTAPANDITLTKSVQVRPITTMTDSPSIDATESAHPKVASPKTVLLPPFDPSLRNVISKRQFMLTPRLGPAKRQKVAKPCAKARTSLRNTISKRHFMTPRLGPAKRQKVAKPCAKARTSRTSKLGVRLSIRATERNTGLNLTTKLVSALTDIRPLSSGMNESMAVQGTGQDILAQSLSGCNILDYPASAITSESQDVAEEPPRDDSVFARPISTPVLTPSPSPRAGSNAFPSPVDFFQDQSSVVLDPVRFTSPPSSPSRETTPLMPSLGSLNDSPLGTYSDPVDSTPPLSPRIPTELSFPNPPIIMIDLKDLVTKLLCARQRGRETSNCRLWRMGPKIVDGPLTTYTVYFEDQRLIGIRLIEFDEPESINSKKKVCVYGCRKRNMHQWISGTGNQRKHLMPPLHVNPTCRQFPESLTAPDIASFLRPRNLSEAGGLDIYFRLTGERTQHLTSLFALGRSLLEYAITKLGMEEMRSVWDYENGRSTDEF